MSKTASPYISPSRAHYVPNVSILIDGQTTTQSHTQTLTQTQWLTQSQTQTHWLMQTQTQTQSQTQQYQVSPSPNVSLPNYQPVIIPYHNLLPFQIGFPLGVVALIITLVIVCNRKITHPTKAATNPYFQNPISENKQQDHLIIDGKIYYYDGPGGKLLAHGWRRVTDHRDVWYVHDFAPPSWTPIHL